MMAMTTSTTPGNRSTIVSTTYVGIAVLFCFGIGLAGGAAYKLLTATRAQPPVGAAASPPRLPTLPQLPPAEPSAPSAALPATALPLAPAQTSPLPRLAAPAAEAAEPPPSLPAAPVTPSVAPLVRRKVAAPQRVAAQTRKPRHMTHSTAPAPSAVGRYRIQFGAFANEENARRVAWAVEATGVKVAVTRAPDASGRALYFVRSPGYRNPATAREAARTVQNRVKHFVNAIQIQYAIIGNRERTERQAAAH